MILYQILMALALPAFLVHAAVRGGAAALSQRLGRLPRPEKTAQLWLHGASLGEVTSARWVIEALRAARPDLQVLVTTNSTTGRDMVTGWRLPGVRAALAPVDTAGAAGRLLDRICPQALVIVENELWPARIAAAHRRGVPVLVVGARISARSARRWRLWPGLIGATLRRIDWLSAQDEASARRLVDLGLPAGALGQTLALKSLTRTPGRTAPFAAPVARAACLLAASTHEGEEGPILAAFATARDTAQASGGLQFLILAPRHPARGDEIARLIEQAGLPFARWSKGQIPGPQTVVLLADTLGDMALWYQMAGTCVIGGTFVARGGHTPFEPAQFGCAILHGPFTANFAAPFEALDQGGGARALSGLQDLALALQEMDPARQSRLATAATGCLAPFAQGADDVIARVLQALPLGPRAGR